MRVLFFTATAIAAIIAPVSEAINIDNTDQYGEYLSQLKSYQQQ